ncbi:MAG: septum formation initiator family protein [Chitinophagaceae bacterium]
MKLFSHIPAWLRNKYLISIGVFAAIMLFFDKNDIFTQRERGQQLEELRQSKQYYSDRIFTERQELQLLKSNPGTLEKYAREKYLMKKEEEDLFIVPEKSSKSKN